uniref:C-X-C motif chemokine 16 n=1 Tax=Ictidomys tridecemlineatus TaxID=43179 RepID=I3MDD2_ICTTR|nr:C-X-C motif chemokine 16 [Ictidomys tridecemlineatus]XP_040125408.1 C-X-C motif chemokine 16 [Ictidomys tridecemlineatus]
MRPSSGPLLPEFLFLLVLLILPGDGNEGSVTGSCPCDERISNNPLSWQIMDHYRKYLRAYRDCPPYIRFELIRKSVCGSIKNPSVRELMSCFDRGECGYERGKSRVNQGHLLFPSTPIPEPTELAPPDTSTPAQMHLPPTQQSTQQFKLPSGVLPLDKELTHLKETTTFTVGYNLGIGFKDGEKQRQKEEMEGTAINKSVMVAVLSLLAIVFILTGVLLYVLCKRRREQSLQCSPGLHYTPVATVFNA